MSNDQEVQVKFSAEIKGLLEGLKQSQEHVGTATEAMKGDLGAMIETLEKVPSVALAAGAAFAIFEGLKKTIEFAEEAIEKTNSLARSFEGLAFQTGASFEELNAYNAAMTMTGGNVNELEGWMKSATRAMKANADILVENGIAANKSALMAMPFTEYLKKVMEGAESIEEPGKRAIFLTESLGRAGLQSAPQIRRFLEVLEKDGVEALGKFGAHIDKDAIESMANYERKVGEVKLAQEQLEQHIAKEGGSISLWWKENLLGITEFYDGLVTKAGQVKELFTGAHFDSSFGEHYFGKGAQKALKNDAGLGGSTEEPDLSPSGLAEPKMKNGFVQISGGEGGHKTKTKEEITEEIAMAKEAAQEKAKAAIDGIEMQKKAEESLYAQNKIGFDEMIQEARKAAEEELQAKLQASQKELALDKGKPVEAQKDRDKKAADRRQYNATISELDDKAALHRYNLEKSTDEMIRELQKGLEKDTAAMAKLAAQDQMDAAQQVLEAKKQELDHEVAMGTITSAKRLAAERLYITQKLAMDKQALESEQAAVDKGSAKWQEFENKKVAAERKANNEIKKLNDQAVEDKKQKWESFFGSMTGGFDSAIKGLIHGTMTWGDAFKEVLNQGLDGLISFFVQWGEQEAARWLASEVMGETGRTTEAAGAAAVYAVNAMSSVAAIPFIGWAMAPGVGAAAYAEGLGMAALASASGGWDQVPSDTLAQIHKDEMVLSAPIAGGLRQMISNGQTGGGSGDDREMHFHFHSLDPKAGLSWFRQNIGSVGGVLREALKNGRI